MTFITPPLSGLDCGFIGSNNTRVKILVGAGDPNTAATDNSATDIAGCGLGSLYLRNDAPDSTHALYVKTGLGTAGSPGTWTAK